LTVSQLGVCHDTGAYDPARHGQHLGRYDPVEHGQYLGDYHTATDEVVEEDRFILPAIGLGLAALGGNSVSLVRCRIRCPFALGTCVKTGLISGYRRCVPSPRTPGAFLCQ